MRSIRALIREIHRRSLWQVLGIYVAGSWGALQAVDLLAANAGLPDWFPSFALALLVLGLPVVLATAFVQEGIGGREEDGGDIAAAGAVDPAGTTAAANLAAGTGSLDRPSTRPAMHRRLLTWRNALMGGVGALALWGVVAAGWLVLGGARAGVDGVAAAAGRGTPGEDRRSIAVLPFANRSAGAEGEFFTAGMHDDILTELSRIPALKVISRTSVLQYRDTDKSIKQIGEELGVSTVLEGAVERAGQRVRITVQLIDAATDAHVWADNYDEELTAENVFAIRSAVAERIAEALEARLTPELRARIEARPTESIEAYDLAQRARYVADTRASSREGLETAAALFHEAIAADSGYAPAWAGLALTLYRLQSARYLPEEQGLREAWSALERALALDPELVEAHALRGVLLLLQHRLEESERAFRHALELNPGSADVHRGYSLLLGELGRFEESVAEARRAVELDPLSAIARRNLLQGLVFARRWDEVIEEARKLTELAPEDAVAPYGAGFAWAFKGEHARAVEAFRRAIELHPADPYNAAGLAWAHAHAGDRARALETLAQAETLRVPLKEIALVYGALGELDTAFAYLERAYETEPASLSTIFADPTGDPLRGDPRWDALMRRLERQ